jgi:hypothetical protein
MTPEELSRIRRIYEQALPLDGSARNVSQKECQGAEAFALRSSGYSRITRTSQAGSTTRVGTRQSVCRSRFSAARRPPD